MAKQVTAFQGFAVFASFDGNAPDSEDLIKCETEVVAQQVCDFLNKEPRKWGQLAFVDGHEHSKFFRFRPTLSLVDDFHVSFEEAIPVDEDEELCPDYPA